MNTYTKGEKHAYLLGMLGQNILYAVISTGLCYYYQSVIFLPAIAISVIMAVSKIFDALKDPIMGTIIDRTNTKWGKCRPYLMFSPVAVCVFSILTFANSLYGSGNNGFKNCIIIVWAACSYILWGISYTFADAPMWTLPSLMTGNENDRNRLLALARVSASIGGAIAVAGIVPISQSAGKLFAKTIGDNEKGLQYGMIVVATLLIIIGAAMFQIAGLFTKEHIRVLNTKKSTVIENFKIMWLCVPYRKLMLSGLLRSPIMLTSIVQMTLFAYYFGDNGRTPYIFYLLLLGGGNMIGQFVASFVTPKLIEKYDKRSLYIRSSVFHGISFALIFILYLIAPTQLNSPLYLAIFFILLLIGGLCQGQITVLQSVMTADCVDYHEYKTSHRPDGVFFSGQTLLIKLSTGISSIISGIGYMVVGFSGERVREINDALFAGASFKLDPIFSKYCFMIFFLFTIPPAIGAILSALPMKKYPLSDKEHKKILELLSEVRNKQ